MTREELQKMIEGSFLRNVPEIMVKENCSMEEAMQRSYDRDERMLLELYSPGVRRKDWAEEFTSRMCEQVYNKLRS